METISLCMIVKDEEDSIANCLDSVSDVVDEIIIVDTGSTDLTRNIASNYNAKIFNFKWKNDFSYARNLSLKYATSDWILVLDADEVLSLASKPVLKEIINNRDFTAYYINVVNKLDTGLKKTVRIIRLFRNSPSIFYLGYIHENIDLSLNEFIKKSKQKVGTVDIYINHIGYLSAQISKKNKLLRNEALIKKQLDKEPENIYMLLRLGQVFRERSNHKEAVFYLRKAYELLLKSKDIDSPLASSVFCQYASEMINSGDCKKAYEVCSEAINNFNVTSSLLYTKALAAQKLGFLDEALQDLNKCLNSDSSLNPALEDDTGTATYHALNSIGEIYRIKKDYKTAKEYFQRAIDKEPFYNLPRHNLSKILVEEGHINDALFQYKSILKSNKEDFLAWISGAKIYEWLKDDELSKEWFENAKKINPALFKKITN